MSRARVLLPVLLSMVLGAVAAPAAAMSVKLPARIGHAMGLVPRHGDDDIAAGSQTPVVYHGGVVMKGGGGVTVHTIFWAPPGFSFHAGYKTLIQQFFTDAAHDSGNAQNVFSVQPQFADGSGAGQYHLNYTAAADSIDATDAFPTVDRCASVNGVPTCLTDNQVQDEIDSVITSTGGTRGLSDLWIVFLPQDVDTCILPGVCGTNAFGGYHAISDVGNGTTIYSNIPDPGVEGTLPGDTTFPNGNPDAEFAIDVAAHETVEAVTDPLGTGWMDPNGFEVADKCEFGPLHGPTLGQAANGADFNQVINGHDYLVQEMWSNNNGGCVQRTSQNGSPLPLAQVNLNQFSGAVSGNVGSNHADGVTVDLLRAGSVVATASTTSSALNGSWSLTLPHSLGDDRDEIDVHYTGATAPADETILTGNGGDPNNEAGWTGWGDLDTETFVQPSEVDIFPCFQVGIFAVTVSASNVPVGVCDTESAVAIASHAISSADTVGLSTNDNRAFSSGNPNGALVKLSVKLGEPDGGFPTCTGDLETGTVACSGLVAGDTYAIKRARGSVSVSADADPVTGSLTAQLPGTPALQGGDVVTAVNSAARTVTTLHIAHLRVDISGSSSTVAAGSCAPDLYYGAFTIAPTLSSSAGGSDGPAGTGLVCPTDGDAAGAPTDVIAQTDDQSGGQTQTEVPDVEDTSPLHGAIVYGAFTALADAGLPGDGSPTLTSDHVSVSIAHSSGGSPVFAAVNVNTLNGVAVPALAPGTYAATWVAVNQNGDTRTVRTRFVEQPANAGPRGPAGATGATGAKGATGARGPRGPRGRSAKVTCRVKKSKIRCKVVYSKAKTTNATVRAQLTRSGHIRALGHARLRHGRATITLLVRGGKLNRGNATLTLVAPGLGTTTMKVRVR